MKNIVAVMRLSKVAQTRAALEEAGFSDFVSRRAMGRGSVEVNDGEAQGDCLIPRRVIYLSVADEDVSRVVGIISQCGRTGYAGDGKIFVMPA
ncbi:MAG: P-II family nitrogen regulator [Eubacteriales bacterium]|nr:P-II family nitrogen regulator [Eubacteriales bacterium]MDD3883053.1 P-II family nitrogen regulator [Eubacteriales bacterium]MDD4513604.1 P-II family nitrogen regulator [Eubacteriales bacterium]